MSTGFAWTRRELTSTLTMFQLRKNLDTFIHVVIFFIFFVLFDFAFESEPMKIEAGI